MDQIGPIVDKNGPEMDQNWTRNGPELNQKWNKNEPKNGELGKLGTTEIILISTVQCIPTSTSSPIFR